MFVAFPQLPLLIAVVPEAPCSKPGKFLRFTVPAGYPTNPDCEEIAEPKGVLKSGSLPLGLA